MPRAREAYDECGRVVTHRALIGGWVFYVCDDCAAAGDIRLEQLPQLS